MILVFAIFGKKLKNKILLNCKSNFYNNILFNSAK